MKNESIEAPKAPKPQLYYKVPKLVAMTDVNTVTAGGDRIMVKAGTVIEPNRKCMAQKGDERIEVEINRSDFEDAIKEKAISRTEVEVPFEG